MKSSISTRPQQNRSTSKLNKINIDIDLDSEEEEEEIKQEILLNTNDWEVKNKTSTTATDKIVKESIPAEAKVEKLAKQTNDLSICDDSSSEDDIVTINKKPINRNKNILSSSDEEEEKVEVKSSAKPSTTKLKKVVESSEEEEQQSEEEQTVNKNKKKTTTTTTTTSTKFKPVPKEVITDTKEEEESEEDVQEKKPNISLKKPIKKVQSSSSEEEEEEQDSEEEASEEDFKPKRLGKAVQNKKPPPPKSRNRYEEEETSSEDEEDDNLYQQESSEESEENSDDDHDPWGNVSYRPKTKKTMKRIESDEEFGEEEELDLAKCVDQLNGFVKHDEKGIYYNTKKSDEGGYFKMKGKVYDGLFWYQRDGVNWLWNLFCRHAGGILGDDMGLGKTMQICSFLNSMHTQGHIKHSLIVMPVGLIEQWCKEFDKFKPNYMVKVFHGNKPAERKASLKSVMTKGGIIITTYGMVVSNVAIMKEFNNKVFSWDYIVLDEGHKIKETKTQISKTMHEFTAKHKIIMTGTAIQNNLRELWALFDWVCDGTLLGTIRDFNQTFSRPILTAHTKDISQNQKVIGSAIAEDLRRIIAPHFLRREKKEVFKNQDNGNNDELEEESNGQQEVEQQQQQEEENEEEEEEEMVNIDGKQGGIRKYKLTPTKRLITPRKLIKKRMSMANGGIKTRKNDFVVWTKLADCQIELYKIFLESDEVIEALNKTKSPLAALTVLKKICDHPHLLREEMKMITGGEMKDLIGKIGLDRSIKSLINNSGKFQLLLKLLPNLHSEGHRVLMFSQSVKMLDDFEDLLNHLGLSYLRIDGSISSTKKRQQIIDEYNSDLSIFAFIMTIQVGALGLNLTSADRVLILDPSWNTIDNQAVDRAYRIGQKKDVVVYRLMSCGTIEEKIYRKQVFKGSLMKTMLNNQSSGQHRYFSSTELRELFILDDTNVSKTQKQLEGLHSEGRKTSPELNKHLEFLLGLKMVYGVSDHDLLFTEAVTTDHNEEDLAKIKDGTFTAGRSNTSRRPNKKKAITVTRDTPNKTVVRGNQYVLHLDGFDHGEEDLEEDLDMFDGTYPNIEFNRPNQPFDVDAGKFFKGGIGSTMSPAPKPTKTLLANVGLGSKRKGNEAIQIIDDDDLVNRSNQKQTEPIQLDSDSDGDDINRNLSKVSFSNSVNNNSNNNRLLETRTPSPIINLDDDDDEEKENKDVNNNNNNNKHQKQQQQQKEEQVSASKLKKAEISSDDPAIVRKIKHFNYLIDSAQKSEIDGKLTESLDLLLDAEDYSRTNGLKDALLSNDIHFKNLVKNKFKKITPPSK